MPLTLTFFALDADGTERTLRRTTIPEETLMVYTSSPEVALTIARNGGPSKPDGFRITDDRMRVRASLIQAQRAGPL